MTSNNSSGCRRWRPRTVTGSSCELRPREKLGDDNGWGGEADGWVMVMDMDVKGATRGNLERKKRKKKKEKGGSSMGLVMSPLSRPRSLSSVKSIDTQYYFNIFFYLMSLKYFTFWPKIRSLQLLLHLSYKTLKKYLKYKNWEML